jgi:hypothetical protein
LIFALLLTGISYSFATPTDGITKKVTASFTKEFSNAVNVKWEKESKYILATFSLNNDVMFAYYNSDGDLIAVARNILSDKLPISQLVSLKKDYNNYWISGLSEVNIGNETIYYATVENADQKIVLRSSDNRGWEVHSTEEKE